MKNKPPRGYQAWTPEEIAFLRDEGALTPTTDVHRLARKFAELFPGRSKDAVLHRVWLLRRRERRLTGAAAACDTVHHDREGRGPMLTREIIAEALQVCLTLSDFETGHALRAGLGGLDRELESAKKVRDAVLRAGINGLMQGTLEQAS